MKTITIDEKIINLEKIHFVRKENAGVLVISFGNDFVRCIGSEQYIDSIYKKILNNINA